MELFCLPENKLLTEFATYMKTKNQYSCSIPLKVSRFSSIVHGLISYNYIKQVRNNHSPLQTIFNRHETFTMPDGGTVCVEHFIPTVVDEKTVMIYMFETFSGTTITLFHPLIEIFVKILHWQVVLIHRRGVHCPLTTAVEHLSGCDEDTKHVLDVFHSRFPHCKSYGVGLSAGGIIMSRFLGKYKPSYIHGAVMISSGVHMNMFEHIDHTLGNFMLGPSRMRLYKYQMSYYTQEEESKVKTNSIPIPKLNKQELKFSFQEQAIYQRLSNCGGSIKKYVEIESELFSKDVMDFYSQHRVENWIINIPCPLMVINAEDDIISRQPRDYIHFLKSCPNILYVLTRNGGHCTFPSSTPLEFPTLNWAEHSCVKFFQHLIGQIA